MNDIAMHTEYHLGPRRTLKARETEVQLRGKRGRFVFQYARVRPNGGDETTELTFYGGTMREGQYVTVRPTDVGAFKKHKRRRPPSAHV